MLDFVATYHPTPEEQAEDARKAHVSGKPFLYSDYLEALERDGYFANDPPFQARPKRLHTMPQTASAVSSGVVSSVSSTAKREGSARARAR